MAPPLAHAACPATAKTCIAVQLWVAPGISESWLKSQIGEANDRLAAIDVGIEVVGVKNLAPSLVRIESRAQRNALLRLGKQTPLRVFLVNRLLDADDRERDRQGVTWRNGDKFVVVVDDDAHAWVLAHELGHVFGLPHGTEYTSIMNKTVRIILPTQLIYTDNERPIMRRTLKRLLASGALVKVE